MSTTASEIRLRAEMRDDARLEARNRAKAPASCAAEALVLSVLSTPGIPAAVRDHLEPVCGELGVLCRRGVDVSDASAEELFDYVLSVVAA